jgi:hypothetical protein
MAPANVNLGIALSSRDVDGAVAAFERAAELFAQQDGAFARQWESFSREKAQSLRRLPAALEEVLAGRRPAESSEEWADAVRVGCRQGRYAEVVALTENTLQGSLEALDDAWTYSSACAAALLAADAATELSAAERARIRGLAHAWLAREVERWRAWIDAGGERVLEGYFRLKHALQDPNFARLRGDALADLPEPERAAWQELWASIAQALEEEEK